MPKGSSSNSETKSQLKTGAERFLVQAMVHALEDGWRTPEDFLRHFKPIDIMTGLEKAPDLRAGLLVKGAGVHEKIARKKSTSSAAEDLRIALDEQVTSPADVLSYFPPDDRVRYLDRAKLWAFVTEDQFWSADGKNERGINRMTFLLNTALNEGLLTLQDIADGVTFETISKRLPLSELQKVVLHALKTGRNKAALSEDSLLQVVPLRDLVSYIPLDQVWKRVIVAKVAQPAAFVTAAPASDEGGWDANSLAPAVENKPAQVPTEPAAEEGSAPLEVTSDDKPAGRRSVPPPKPVKDAPKESLVSLSGEEVDQLLQPGRPGPEEEARRRVTERLQAINRLPPRHEELSTAILLSIESMYADLLSASTDEARELCIRESFPNEGHLTTALLAMIELLDPSIDVNDPVIKEADVDSLIKVVLFEERHRYEQAHPSARPPTAPPPPPTGSRRSLTPPPLPRAGGAPPPLPELKR